MNESRNVVCGAHGETPATFTCRHLADGTACGFHSAESSPNDPWPDAWCDLCEEALQATGGEWTPESEAVARICLQCTGCYASARDRNRDVPPLARGHGARLSTAEAAGLLSHSVEQARATQSAAQEKWGLGSFTRWDFDAEASELVLTDAGQPTVVADVHLIGSFSKTTDSFQWAWATFENGAPEARASNWVRTFGEVRGLPALVQANQPCEEVDAWEMASLAGYLLRGDALYRAPMDHLYWFMVLTGLRHRVS